MRFTATMSVLGWQPTFEASKLTGGNRCSAGGQVRLRAVDHRLAAERPICRRALNSRRNLGAICSSWHTEPIPEAPYDHNGRAPHVRPGACRR